MINHYYKSFWYIINNYNTYIMINDCDIFLKYITLSYKSKEKKLSFSDFERLTLDRFDISWNIPLQFKHRFPFIFFHREPHRSKNKTVFRFKVNKREPYRIPLASPYRTKPYRTILYVNFFLNSIVTFIVAFFVTFKHCYKDRHIKRYFFKNNSVTEKIPLQLPLPLLSVTHT